MGGRSLSLSLLSSPPLSISVFFSNSVVPLEFVPWEIRVACPPKSQLQQSRASHPQGMDRPGVRQVPEGSGEQGKMEKTGCEIIRGAPWTLAVKGLMMMMMMMTWCTFYKQLFISDSENASSLFSTPSQHLRNSKLPDAGLCFRSVSAGTLLSTVSVYCH